MLKKWFYSKLDSEGEMTIYQAQKNQLNRQ